jgi:hypothetical protein
MYIPVHKPFFVLQLCFLSLFSKSSVDVRQLLTLFSVTYSLLSSELHQVECIVLGHQVPHNDTKAV